MLKINRKLSQRGFSLIELMVAAAILAIAIFGIFQAYSTGFMGMADAKYRTYSY
jgi:prepilin-type N-terminal cleavage/methylation domain-containing protein